MQSLIKLRLNRICIQYFLPAATSLKLPTIIGPKFGSMVNLDDPEYFKNVII